MGKLRKFLILSSLFTTIIIFVFGVITFIYFNNKSIFAENKLIDMIKLDNLGVKKLDKPFNTLVLGGDPSHLLTDTIMVVNLNPQTKKLSVLSIPRDTQVKYNNIKQKINGIVNLSEDKNIGIKNLIGIIKENFDIEIDNYLFFDTQVLKDSVDILGGVNYYVPVKVDYDDSSQDLHIHFEEGYQHLNGEEFVELLRFRKRNNRGMSDIMKYYDGSDLKRIDAQQSLIRALLSQKVNLANIAKLEQILEKSYDKIFTDYDINNFIRIIYNVGSIDFDNMDTFRIQGYDNISNGQYFFMNNNLLIDTKTDEVLDMEDVLLNNFQHENYKDEVENTTKNYYNH